jgi:hypothetical protein
MDSDGLTVVLEDISVACCYASALVVRRCGNTSAAREVIDSDMRET